jgi:hypothetical protein
MPQIQLRSDLKEIILSNSSHKQFRNIKDADMPYVRGWVTKLLATLAIKNKLIDIEIETLIIFLKKQFPNNTFGDIELAGDYNSARRLTKFHEHFQLLHRDFIGAVLIDFNVFLREANVELAKAKEQATETIKKLPEAKDSAYQYIKSYYEENKSFPMAANWSSAFDWMWSNGLTESHEDMVKWFEIEGDKIKKEIIDEMFYAKNVVEKRTIEIKLEGNYVKMEARKRYVMEYFSKGCR